MKHLFRTFLFSFLFTTILLAGAKIDPKLQEAMLNSVGPHEVVVTFTGNSSPTLTQKTILTQLGILKGFTFKQLPMAGVLATTQQLNLLKNDAQVRSLYLNSTLTYHNNNSTALTGVDKVRTNQNYTIRNGGMPVSGKGVTVLIHDSGIDGTHEDVKFGTHLKQNTLGSTNPHAYDLLLPIVYVENVPSTDNNSGHGTHVAGIVGGTGLRSGIKYEGVAPGADLVGYGSGAVLLVLDALGGFDYGLSKQYEYGIKIITNSWGSSGDFDPDNPVNVATKLVYDRGMIVLFSAGNSGPGEWTLTPYAAPWVLTIGAGDRYGNIADFSSRGLKDHNFSFELDGQTWIYENQPTIVGPGVDVISTRAAGPLPLIGDDAEIEPAFLPFYTTMSGTSMSCPHIAGVVALMLDANPLLTFEQIKSILQTTATNMPGFESWEVGAGYVNALAAVDMAFGGTGYGGSVNAYKQFNSNVEAEITRTQFSIDFNPAIPISSTQNEYTFNVPEGTSALDAIAFAHGIVGEEGNPVDLGLYGPDGSQYHSNIYVAFPLYHDRSAAVLNPVPGEWKVRIQGLTRIQGLVTGPALPEVMSGYIKLTKFNGYSGLNDIEGTAGEDAIKLGVVKRLLDGDDRGYYNPKSPISRIDLAKYLMSGQAVRQYIPYNGQFTFNDLATQDEMLFAESVNRNGAALKDRFFQFGNVIKTFNQNLFDPEGTVSRVYMAYTMVQSLGLQPTALSFNGTVPKVHYNGQEIPLDDASEIPAGLEGYVQVALDMNLMNAYFSLVQGPYDPNPVLHAKFSPANIVTREDFAVIVTKTFTEWIAPVEKEGVNTTSLSYELGQNYPNPFNPSTSIRFSVPADAFVTLEVYNALGEKVTTLVNEQKPAGTHTVNFNASGLSSGVYLYKINAGKFSETRKMTILK